MFSMMPDKPAVARVKTMNIRKIVIKLENGIDQQKVREYLKFAQQQMEKYVLELQAVLDKYRSLGISQQIDYDKFYLYSIITHSTACRR